MGLLDKSTSASTAAAFESDDASATAAAETVATAVAVKPSASLTTSTTTVDVLAAFKNALRVDYNTLSQIKLTNGNFVERETNLNLGDTVVFELLSFQDSYTVTPNQDKAPVETLKFSDDGVTCNDGTPVAQHIADLKEQGYEKAGVKHRCVVVGALQSASKSDKFNDSLVQFDLSPETRVLFERYRATTAYLVRAGKVQADKAARIKGVTRLVTKGSNTFTVSDFSVA